LFAASVLSACGDSKSGKTKVTISIGQVKTSSLSGDLTGKSSIIPSSVTKIRFTISASDMTTIQRTVSTSGKTAVSESFDVPNGTNRRFFVEALDVSDNLKYHGEKHSDLSGPAVNLDVEMVVATQPLSPDTWGSISATNTPGARIEHAAFWTGSKMLVWGGRQANNGPALNTGGIYDPASDSWSAMSSVNAPSARLYYSSVWTGTEMIIWGGWSGGNLNTGARYNPSTDSWTATTTVNAPAARCLMPAVWTGSTMIVWGGFSQQNTGGIYDPSTDTWIGATSTSGAPSGRQNHMAAWTGNEMIVWGGRQYAGGFYFNDGGRYNPATNTWTAVSTTNAPSARVAALLWTGTRMIVWGGWIDSGRLNTGAVYNPSNDTWTTISTTNAPTASSAYFIWTGTEFIVWAGGLLPDVPNGKYNPVTDTWSSISTVNMPSGRTGYSAAWTGTEMIIWGGEDSGGGLITGGKYVP
jgi:N-acetylneuraminic acid mutarotase